VRTRPPARRCRGRTSFSLPFPNSSDPARGYPYHLAGRSLRPSWASLTRMCLRCAIHGCAGHIRRLNGRGSPSPPHVTQPYGSARGCPCPRAGYGSERRKGWRSEAEMQRAEAGRAEANVQREGMGSPSRVGGVEAMTGRSLSHIGARPSYFFFSSVDCMVRTLSTIVFLASPSATLSAALSASLRRAIAALVSPAAALAEATASSA